MKRSIQVLLCFLFTLQAEAAVENVSHRGYASGCPENSHQAMRQAWERGATVLETDVQTCRGDVLVLFHDTEVDDHPVVEMSVSELEEKVGHDIALLSDFLDQNAGNGVVLLDLKNYGERFLELVCAVIEASNFPREQIILQSTDQNELVFLKKRIPEARTHWLTSLDRQPPRMSPPDPASLAASCVENGIDGVTAKGRRFVDADYVREFTRRGLDYYVWTINPVDRIRHYRDAGVTGIVSDDPAKVRDVLAEGR